MAAELIIVLEVGAATAERLDAILAAVPVSTVVFAAGGDKAISAPELAPLVATAQRRGVTALVSGDARLARTVKADGVHLAVSEKASAGFEEARAVLGGRGVIGADAGRSRHDAMTLGELGADYVAFGIPAFVKDRETAVERRLDLVSWWAEIFEIPCVAMDVDSVEQAGQLAAAGADFVSLSIGAGVTVADALGLATSWREAIEAAGAPPVEERNS